MNIQDSYTKGDTSSQLLNVSIGQRLEQIAQKLPNQLAFISHYQEVQFTYIEFFNICQKLGAALLKIGLQKGDRVGIYSPNNYQWCITQFAASMADLILVNINPAYQQHELEYCLNKVGCKGLIMASHHRKSNYIKFINELAPELQDCQFGELNSRRLPSLKYVVRIDDEQTPGMINFQTLIEKVNQDDINHLQKVMEQINPNDPTNIQFTSGTTGYPKGATLTHNNILNNGYFIGERLSYSPQDRICLSVPLYHCFGMVLGNLAALNFGATIVLPSEGFNAQKALEAVTKHKCTSLYGVPTMFIEYFKEYDNNPGLYKVDSLRKGIMAGALCPQPLMNKLITEWNIQNIQICYGQTECSPVVFQTLENDSVEDKCSTVGTIFPHCEMKLIDNEGKIVPVGEKGEICIRGFGVMQKYWGDIKATSETINEEGWLKTGDLGQVDVRGYLKIVGRIKELIIRGGENIYPKEIEEYLRRHEKVLDVQVVAIPDVKYGEETFCLIKLKEGVTLESKDIYHFCHGQISHYKIPKYVKFVDSFPQTVTGKYQKFKMVEELVEEQKQNPAIFEQYKIRHY
ncbi:acyl-CoA synthetase family (AMP-forming)/AMP-acid ligase family protein (macronuclear) [Tetrahymena thermophila SB210]|uniref:Acyl-CoA synthetase family (AMP-forming)/AMP-acid ligase family protein n=1 Tax=Tetrahymena thermophila (strain SB210) TaxID=312017 RepID=I7MHV6_TETTS|nr:acyl-CoA synthetase family (AMP-forming)/AMP-acid ligase family protein [Tetrahymena thermophila SB210]EAR89926.2 acyl-CoA synthetase family (AMP-forming)/AMP-acid ligase family protein [Tetrahymena thermophila SB210]|eukprot:XP_001010171.2 acyl-CoA synthetase family (AMP-forming)/AMP-acid ligase family protein [Tetrahymena thermophila SB210]